MNIKHARVRVAECWFSLHPKAKVMDPVLAELFAKMLKNNVDDLQERVAYQSQTITDLDTQIENQSQEKTRLLEGNHKIAKAGQEVSLRLIDALQRENELIDQIVELHEAADALYMSGYWVLLEDDLGALTQAKLWEDLYNALNNALDYEPDYSTEAGVNTAAVVAGETITCNGTGSVDSKEEAADPDVAFAAGDTSLWTGDDDDLVDSKDDLTVSEVVNFHLEEIKSLLEGIEWNTRP